MRHRSIFHMTATAAAALCLLAADFLLVAGPAHSQDAPPAGKVVFVCEHGTVKSVIAREWFDRLARERGLDLTAESRGVAPDEAIPPAIVERLREDGFDVAGFEPAPLEAADVAGAVAVVAIGVDSPLLEASEGTLVERWDDIPPASKEYEASRDALRRHIKELLTKLSSDSEARP